MIVLYPALLATAVLLVLSRDRDGGRGWRWFGIWATAGAAFTFSFLTGLSIGLLLLPVVAATLLFAALGSPHLTETTGFVAGAGVVAVLVGALNWGEDQSGVEPAPWLLVGLAAATAAVFAYALAARRRESQA